MKARRLILPLAFIAMAVCLRLSFPSYAIAAWNPAGESGEVIYEVKPLENKIHVKATYYLKNLDLETFSRNAYYYSWNAYADLNASSIQAYDSSSSRLFFTRSQRSSFNVLQITLNAKLFYGQTYTFTIEYDLQNISPNNATFKAYGDTEESWIKIMLPRGYYSKVYLSQEGSFREETATNTIYTYYEKNGGRDFSTTIELIKDSETTYKQFKSVIRMSKQNVNLTVNYWAGYDNKAGHVSDTAARGLPVLEDIIGVPFPHLYSISISQSSSGGIGRWGGVNRGSQGILMPYDSPSINDVLLHELAHYWAREPPFGDTWMSEGQADLYAYLALQRLGFADEANLVRYLAVKAVDNIKNSSAFPLLDWNNPDTITASNEEYISLMYSKSFLFTLNLYEKIGLQSIQKSNKAIFSLSKPVNWFEYLNLLEKSSGQDLTQLFTQFVLPNSYANNYNQLVMAKNSYRQLESLIAPAKGSYGIHIVEKENRSVADLIIGGDLPAAQNKAQIVKALYDRWLAANRIYMDAEKAISASKGMTGIGPVEKELKNAQDLLINGGFGNIAPQIEFTLRLYTQWQSAEKKYRETYNMISPKAGAMGIALVNKELEAVRDLLLAGQYDKVSSKVESVLTLYGQWQNAVIIYGEAEKVISPYKASPGIAPVVGELKKAESLLIAGQYNLISIQSESVLAMFDQWQKASQIYRDAGDIISPYKEAMGMIAVNTELKAAEDLLASGKYDMVSAKVESALTMLEIWKKAEKSYREADSILSPYRGALGMTRVNEELKTVRDLLEKGQYAAVAVQMQSALKLYETWKEVSNNYNSIVEEAAKYKDLPGIGYIETGLAFAQASLRSGDLNKAAGDIRAATGDFSKWESVYNLYLEAGKSVVLAGKEKRTWGLQKAKNAMLEGENLLKAGSLDESRVKLEHAINEAKKAVTPFKALVGPMVIALSFIVAIIAVILFVHRRTVRKNTI